MAESEGRGSGRKWLTCGCGGCLAILALVVLIIAATFGGAWVGVRNEDVVERTLEREIPTAATEEREIAGQPGRVILRMRNGEFHVEPAGPGEPLHVDARYDQRSYDLVERFEPGEDGWVYELDFRGKGSFVMSLLKAVVGGAGARVTVYLPQDVPLELEIDISQGGMEMDLGGLWLTRGEIEFSQGGFELDIDEPLREPMESLKIHGSMGGFVANGLGNASPRRFDLECRMGGMELDLRGDWVVDSNISIHTRQGGASVRLPRDVNIVGLEGRGVSVREKEEIPRPTLTFSVSADQGDMEFFE